MKTCCNCLKRKHLKYFSKDNHLKSGYSSYCKDCKNEWDKWYYQTRKFRKYVEKNRERIRRNTRRFMSTPHGKKSRIENAKRMRLKFPEKHKAREKLRYEVNMGRIKRKPCQKCGNPISEAHHTDYSKPLEVKWLCKKHHVQVHLR